jgi:quinol monooxygenase YgiN
LELERKVGNVPTTAINMRIVAPPDRRAEIIQVFRSLMGPLEANPACTECRLYQQHEKENSLAFVEEWRSREDLERHMQTDDYRALLSLLDLSLEPPEVRLQTIDDTQGMELLAAIRGGGENYPRSLDTLGENELTHRGDI